MAEKRLLVTLGLDATSYTQNIKRAKDLNKELDSSFKLLSNTGEKFENSLTGLGKKQEYLSSKMKVATGLTEVYANRLKDSQKELEKATKNSQEYAEKVANLQNQMKGLEGTDAYTKLNKELKANKQLFDKAEKSIALYNRRILEAKDGYNTVQTEIQKLNKEITINAEKMNSMKGDERFNGIKNNASQLRHEFEVLSTSTENFSNSMFGLSKTEEYYSKQIKNTKTLMKGYASEMEKSKNSIKQYEETMNTLQKELLEVEQTLRGMDSTDDNFESIRAHAEDLRMELSALSSNVEHHKQRIETLGNEYNKSELELAKMTKSLKVTKAQMKELADSVDFKENAQEIDKFANSTLELLQQEIKQTEKSFDSLKNSVSGFGKSAKDLKAESEHLVYLLELTGKATKEYESDIAKVNKEINRNIGLQQRQVKHIEKLKTELQGIDKSSKAWDTQKAKIDKAIDAYNNITQRIDVYKQKLNSLEQEKAQLESQSVKLNGALDKNVKTMKQMNDSVTFEPISREIKELTNQTINKLSAEMDKLKDDFEILSISSEKLENSLTGLSQKQEHYNKALRIAKQTFNEYNKELTECESKVNSLTNEQKELEAEITQQIAKLKTLDGSAWDEQKASIDKLKEKYKEVNKDLDLHSKRLKEVESGYRNSRRDVATLNSELNKTQNQLKQFNKLKIFEGLDREAKELSNKLKLLDSSFKVTESQVKNFGRTKQDLAQKTQFYESKLATLGQQMNNFKATIVVVEGELTKLGQKKETTIKKIDELRRSMQNMDKDSPKFQETIQATARLESELEGINADIDKYKNKHNELQVELNQTTAETNKLTRETNELASAFVASKFERFGNNLTTVGSGLQQAGQSMLGLSFAVGGLGGAMVKTGTDFTESMSQVRAVTGATDKDFQELTEVAKEMGRTTTFSSKESADALTYLGLAGYTASQSIDALPLILQTAQAGAMDLATASDLATDAVASLGFVGEEAVKELPDFLDKVAEASTKSNTSIEQMLKAYIKVGGQFDNLNIKMDTSASMLGVLANRGLKAEEAGTSLNSVLINMTKTSGESAEAMEQLGVSFFDSKGEIKDVETVIVELAGALNKLSEEDRVKMINMIGGKTQAKAIQKLLQGMIDDTGNLSEEYKKLKEEISTAPDTNALENMSKTMTDNLGGDLKILVSTIKDSFLSIFDSIEPQLRSFVQNLTDGIKKVTDAFLSLSPEAQTFILKMIGLLALLPPFLIILGTMSNGLGVLSKGFGKLTSATNLFGKGVNSAGGKTSFLAKNFKLLGLSIKGSTVAIGAGVVALGTIVYSIGENENALAWLMDKWGVFGEFVADVCERFSGVVQITLGNIGHLISGIGKSIGALLSGNWRDIDDIWRETWADMENTTARAMSNIRGESTKALRNIRKASKDDLDYVKLMFKQTLEVLPTVTKDNLDQVAQTFTGKFSMLSEDSLEILRGTSDTMAILLDGIVEGMDTSSLNKKLQENMKGLLNAGKISADEIEKDFSKANKLISQNMADSFARATKEARNAVKEFERFSVLGMDETASKVAGVIDRMSTESFETLSTMGGTWGEVFKGISKDAEMSTEEMKNIIIANLNELGANTPEGMNELIKTIKEQLNEASTMTQETVNKTNEAVNEQVAKASEGATTIVETMKNATSGSMEELYANVVEGVKLLGADTAKELSTSSDAWYGILHGAFNESGELSDTFLQTVQGNFNHLNLKTPEQVAEFAKHLEEGMKTANINATEEATKTKENVSEQTQAIADASKDVGMEITENVTPENLQEKVTEAMQQAENSLNGQKANFAEEARQIASEAESKFRSELENMATVEIPDTVLNVEKITGEMGLAGQIAVQAFANSWNNNSYIITDGIIGTFSSIPAIINVPFDNLSSTLEGVGQKMAILGDTTSIVAERVRQIEYINLATSITAVGNLKSGFDKAGDSAQGLKKVLSEVSAIKITGLNGDFTNTITRMRELTSVAKTTKVALDNVAKIDFKRNHVALDTTKNKLNAVERSADNVRTAINKFLSLGFSSINSNLNGITSRLGTIASSAGKARSALSNMNSVNLSGLLSKLSSVNSWLNNIKANASQARANIASMNSAQASANYAGVGRPRALISDGISEAINTFNAGVKDFNIANYQVSGGYYNPTSMRGVSSNGGSSTKDDSLLKALLQQNDLLMRVLGAERNINVSVGMNGREIARGSARYMEEEINKLNKRKNRLGGNM